MFQMFTHELSISWNCFILFSSGHFNLFDLGPEQGSAVKQNRPKPMKIRGQAFGVGAYERDDEDIYGKDDMSNYDFSLPTQDVSTWIFNIQKFYIPFFHQTFLSSYENLF